MKKQYTGIKVEKILLTGNEGSILTASPSKCVPVYTTHFDTNNDLVCDSQQQLPGSSDVTTQSWNDCEVGLEED